MFTLSDPEYNYHRRLQELGGTRQGGGHSRIWMFKKLEFGKNISLPVDDQSIQISACVKIKPGQERSQPEK